MKILRNFLHKKSEIEKVLLVWIKNPKLNLYELLNEIKEKEIKTEFEAKLICKSLKVLRKNIKNAFDENQQDSLYELTVLFQSIKSKIAGRYLDKNGIELLVDIFDFLQIKNYPQESYGSSEMMMLKMFAYYQNSIGLQTLINNVKTGFKPSEYLWSVIFDVLAEDSSKYRRLISGLDGNIPKDFAGIAYLDMCNRIALKTDDFKHPFNANNGYNFLDDIIKNSSAENQSYVVSATATIPFLEADYQEKLLALANDSKDTDVQIEMAWAGAKLNKDKYVNQLVEFAKDYSFSSKATSYLVELGLSDKIPKETLNNDFQALSEMSSWLSHPNEFGSYPDKLEIFDKRKIHWPPTDDKRTIYLIKYTYENYNDNTPEIGIGLVGSVTFCLFGLDNVLNLKPLEILAIHCNWELQNKNYEDIESGLRLLKECNEGIL